MLPINDRYLHNLWSIVNNNSKFVFLYCIQFSALRHVQLSNTTQSTVMSKMNNVYKLSYSRVKFVIFGLGVCTVPLLNNSNRIFIFYKPVNQHETL